ncbi:nitroreductase [Methanomicrobium sp. W14]|uniref:nitroreductase family protein n=1 Tax=Methanomicrobium sp. W14 TaxID=2817839 RepID=UPI001AE0EA6F|nr:nitroreductase family protein [Methanomicrobium sp. W14]MBP2134210.1 nitroreductase [Methanomicrobium sp. W14]
MDTMDAIMTRRSIRKFEERQIPDEILNRIILAGTYAPSALALQPWAFVVIQDKEFLKEISDYCAPVLLSNMRKSVSHEGMSDKFRKLLEGENYSIYYNAPTVILIAGKNTCRFKDIDCSLCAENMMLAAHALGVGSCFVGSSEIAYENKELLEKFRIPEGSSPVGTIAFGYPLEKPKAGEKLTPKVVRI